jgi:hypothetical protein
VVRKLFAKAVQKNILLNINQLSQIRKLFLKNSWSIEKIYVSLQPKITKENEILENDINIPFGSDFVAAGVILCFSNITVCCL